MNYEDHEKVALNEMHLAGATTRQGKRISMRLQAALNYALARELEIGIPLDFSEITDGVVNGFCGVLVQLHLNAAHQTDPSTADEYTKKVLRAMQETWSAQRLKYLQSAQFEGAMKINQHTAGHS